MKLNKDLELTDKAEIERLKKVIDEKNKTIKGFKKYDEERKRYYARFEENYKMMEERFNEFNSAVEECEGLECNTKRYFEAVVQKIYNRRVNDDIEGGALMGVLTRLTKINDHLEKLVCIASLVGDSNLKNELLGEIHTTQMVRANAVSYVKRKLKIMT